MSYFLLDFVNDTVGEDRIMKRSGFSRREKRLMTVEIFTIIDYSIFNKWVANLQNGLKSLLNFITKYLIRIILLFKVPWTE